MRTLLACVALLLGCGPDDAATGRSNEFVGRWAGQYSDGDEQMRRYLIERKADGSYERQTFWVVGDKPLAIGTETGKWFLQEGSYKVKVETTNGRAASVTNTATYQTFSIGEVQADSIRLTHSLSGAQLLERRVALDYKFP